MTLNLLCRRRSDVIPAKAGTQFTHDLWHAEREVDTSKLQPLPKAS